MEQEPKSPELMQGQPPEDVVTQEPVERLPYSDEEAIRRAKQADREMIERIATPVEARSDK